jgi:hypothetical protein
MEQQCSTKQGNVGCLAKLGVKSPPHFFRGSGKKRMFSHIQFNLFLENEQTIIIKNSSLPTSFLLSHQHPLLKSFPRNLCHIFTHKVLEFEELLKKVSRSYSLTLTFYTEKNWDASDLVEVS